MHAVRPSEAADGVRSRQARQDRDAERLQVLPGRHTQGQTRQGPRCCKSMARQECRQGARQAQRVPTGDEAKATAAGASPVLERPEQAPKQGGAVPRGEPRNGDAAKPRAIERRQREPWPGVRGEGSWNAAQGSAAATAGDEAGTTSFAPTGATTEKGYR